LISVLHSAAGGPPSCGPLHFRLPNGDGAETTDEISGAFEVGFELSVIALLSTLTT
jgi:hypothetical protein